MVLITGAVAGAIATCPPAVAILGPTGASAAGGALIPTVAAAEGVAGGLGGAVLAVGEGAVVGAGVVGGGSGSAGIALATFVGPVGWAIVGCDKVNHHNGDGGYTWDCWKPIVREKSTRPSQGITLRDLAHHPNVQSMSFEQNKLLVENIFGQRFRLTPVNVEGMLAFHASLFSM